MEFSSFGLQLKEQDIGFPASSVKAGVQALLCRKMCKGCSAVLSGIGRKGWLAGISCNTVVLHMQHWPQSPTSAHGFFATSSGEKKAKEENAPKTSHL